MTQIVTMSNVRDGRYRVTVNLLRKYLGDFLIASYLDVSRESGYDDAYIKEIEVMILLHELVNIETLILFLERSLSEYAIILSMTTSSDQIMHVLVKLLRFIDGPSQGLTLKVNNVACHTSKCVDELFACGRR